MSNAGTRILPYLSIACISLAILAVAVGDRSSTSVSINLRSLAQAIDQEEDHLTPEELRTMLTSGRGVQLVDLRDSASFVASHIPGATNSTVAGVLEMTATEGIPMVLYSDGGIHAAQAWMLLKAKGDQEVYTLLGSWKAWISGADTSASRNTTAVPSPKKAPKPPNMSKEREKLYGEC